MINNNPIHIHNYELLHVYDNLENYYITPKADGTGCNLIYNGPNNLTVASNSKKGTILKCEYIESLDIYLVYDIINSFQINTSYKSKMIYLSKLHGNNLQLHYKIICMEDLHNALDLFNDNLKQYLLTTCDKIKWFPKPIFTFDIHQKQVLFDVLDNEYINIFPTDGHIIMSDIDNHIYKYKPKYHNTVDLTYNNNILNTSDNHEINFTNGFNINLVCRCIYRCYWINGEWWPKERRHDKIFANPKYVVDELEILHNNYWKAKDLYNYKYVATYYNHNIDSKLSESIQHILEYKNILLQNIMKNINIDKKNIMDIGSGNGNIIKLLSNRHAKYVGIDIDPICVYNTSKKYTNKKNIYIWNNFMDYELFGNKYDIIFMINTIHYFINDLDRFLKKMADIMENNGVGIIMTIDYDEITNLNINNEIIVKKCDDNDVEFYYSWLNRNFTEKYINHEHLSNKMNEHGFNIMEHNIDVNMDFWKMHRIYIIRKM